MEQSKNKIKNLLNLPICLDGLSPQEAVAQIMIVLGVTDYTISTQTVGYLFVEDSKVRFLLNFYSGHYHSISLCPAFASSHPYPNYPFKFEIKDNQINYISELKQAHRSFFIND